MEVQGKVIKVLEARTGKSGDKEWKAQTFVVQTTEEYNNLYPIESFNKAIPVEGQMVNVHYNINAREYEGKYFTKLSLWKWESLDAEQAVEAPTDKNGLPF